MGIRFYCPNGHKLNVKAFQAGKTGICPQCGAKMQIPLKSTRSPTRPWESRRKQKEARAAAAEKADVAAESSAPPVPPAGTATVAGSASKLPDPLADAADVVWYVRPASGGQYGPAKSDVMRSWIGEGRVASDTLVWREGWREWRDAGNVFPQLSPNQAMPELESIIATPTPAAGQNRPPTHSDKANIPLAVIIGAVVVIVVTLFIGLLVFLLNR